MEEKVSVIVPVYKAAQTVRRCAESIISGSYKNIELILIEDCSPDNSLDICRNLALKHECIRVFANKKNSGVSHTRNVGLENMTGKYTVFVDSDDWVTPDYIEKLVSAMEYSDNSMALCGYINHDEVQNNLTTVFAVGDRENYIKEHGSLLLALYRSRLLQQLWNKIFLSEVIRSNNIRFDETLSMGEDFRFILEYLELSQKKEPHLIGEPLYHYSRDNPDSLMASFGTENINNPLSDAERLIKLTDLPKEKKLSTANKEKLVIKNQYTYKIMHDKKLSLSEKRRMILSIHGKNGNRVFLSVLVLVIKERLKGFR